MSEILLQTRRESVKRLSLYIKLDFRVFLYLYIVTANFRESKRKKTILHCRKKLN